MFGQIDRESIWPGPDDELPRAARRDHNGRAVTRLFVECVPHFLPGRFVERYHACRRFAANAHDEKIVLDQRRRGGARELLHLIIRSQVSFPNRIAGARIEAAEMSYSAQGVDAVTRDNGRSARTAALRLGKHPLIVIHLLSVSPQHLTTRLVETVDAFAGLGPYQFGIGDINAALRHDGT